MPVIVIDSETGSEGPDIANRVARRLGLSMLDHSNVLDRLAQHGFSLPECPTPQALAGVEQENNWQQHEIGKIISAEIMFLARKNSMLIHSPYAPHLLAGISHIPRIRVRAPVTQRARNFSAANGCSEAEALQEINRKDRQTDWILENCFRIDSPNRAENFDLVADSGWLSAQDWAEQILDLVQDPDFFPNATSIAKLCALASHLTSPQIKGNRGSEPCQTSTPG